MELPYKYELDISLIYGSYFFSITKIFILTNNDEISISESLKDRVFFSEQEVNNFIAIDNEIYLQKGGFIHQDKSLKHPFIIDFKDSVKEVIISKIEEISPQFQFEKYLKIEDKIQRLEKTSEFSSTKEAKEQAKKIGEEKNKLYGAKDKKQKKRIEKFEEEGKTEELKNTYPQYWQNRTKILKLIKEQERLNNFSNKELDELRQKRNQLIPKDKKENILKLINLLKELEE